MASLMVREEPLLKQLVRSRALNPTRAHSAPRSSSQPPPASRCSPPQLREEQLKSPVPVTYTLQFLPYNLVYNSHSGNLGPRKKQSLSISQPDLTKMYSQAPPVYSPPRMSSLSRDTSPIRGFSSSLRSSLNNLSEGGGITWPNLASNSVLLPMTDAVPSPTIRVEDEDHQLFTFDVNNNNENTRGSGSENSGFCQMCYLLNKPRLTEGLSNKQCDSCLFPLSQMLLENNNCLVGSAKPSETSVYVNGCEILGPPGRGGGGYKSLRGNNNMLLGETNNNSQQRYFPRSDGASHPQLTSAGVSRLTSRGVSPARDRASDGYHHHQQHQLFASFCSASGSNQGAIDNRIEQAMDLVKSHLMNAVRSEVEELKERIVKLEDVITHLQTENDFLKANVSQDVLTQLPVLSQTQQQSSLPCSGGTPTTNNGGGGLSPTTGTAILQPLVVTTQQQPQL